MADTQKLNVDTSIVDLLKSKGEASDFSSRTDLAVQYGIVSDPSKYYGTSDQNIALMSALKGSQSGGEQAPIDASDSQKEASTTDMINASQDRDMEMAGPAIRESSAPSADFYNQLAESLSTATKAEAPTAPSFSETYAAMREEHNVKGLESRLADLQRQEREQQQIRRERIDMQEGKRVAQGVIEGRVGEIEKQENRRINQLQSEMQFVSDQLNNRYNTINTMMQLKQTDYQNTLQAYESKFNRTIQTIQTLTGLEESMYTREQAVREDARANWTIFADSVLNAGMAFNELSTTQQAHLNKLETQGGLPSGITEFMLNNTPSNEEILATIQSADGTKVSFLTKVGDEIKTRVVSTGLTAGEATGGDGKTADWTIAEQIIADKPDATNDELRQEIRMRTNLMISDVDALLNQREKEPLSVDSVKTKIVTTLDSVKDIYTRSEAQDLAEKQLKDALDVNVLPEAFSSAIEDALVEVYGRTFWQKAIPGGR